MTSPGPCFATVQMFAGKIRTRQMRHAPTGAAPHPPEQEVIMIHDDVRCLSF